MVVTAVVLNRQVGADVKANVSVNMNASVSGSVNAHVGVTTSATANVHPIVEWSTSRTLLKAWVQADLAACLDRGKLP